jgi:hypothetical protein
MKEKSQKELGKQLEVQVLWIAVTTSIGHTDYRVE